MSKDAKKIISQAQKYQKAIETKESFQREKAKECENFVAGEQWSEEDIKARGGQPTLTINKLSKPIDVVTNRHWENQSSIKLKAFEDDDADTVKVLNGLIKRIENSNKSQGKVAYRSGFNDSVVQGVGYWRVSTEFSDEKSFEQEIVIEEIENPKCVYYSEDKCLITETISKEEFEDRFPDAETASWNEDQDSQWTSGEDDVTIAEYWVRKKIPTKIYQIERVKQSQGIVQIEIPGQMQAVSEEETEVVVVTEEELAEMENGAYEILDERKTHLYKVIQYLLSPSEILDTMEWKGKYIPIVRTHGQKYRRDGKIFFKGVPFDGVDPQKLLNYFKSQNAATLQKAPKNQYMVSEGQIAGHEDEWANPDDYQTLVYSSEDINGRPTAPPQPLPPPQISSGLVQAIQEADADIKNLTVPEESLGMTSNAIAGRAILARQAAASLSTEHFNINFNLALRQTGLILLDLIPHIYDTERTIRIVGEDMREEVVTINKKYRDKTGKELFYDLRKMVNCDVTIQSAYSSGTRRQEVVDTLLEFAKLVPQSAQVSGDIIASQLDMEKSDELQKRLKALIPPEIFTRMDQMEQEDKGGATPEQVQLQKMGQMVKQLQMQLMQTANGAKQLAQENTALKKRDDAIKLQVQGLKNEGDVKVANIKRDSDIKTSLITKRE